MKTLFDTRWVYPDTSLIAPYYQNELSSAAVAKVLQATPVEQLVLSSWTITEFASMLARRVRVGELSQALALQVMASFEQDLKSSLIVIEPIKQDFEVAGLLTLKNPAQGLRGADALHLAVAVSKNLPIYTLDKTFIRAATELGYSASDAGVLS